MRSLRGGFRPISPREAQAHFPRLGAINLRGFRSALSDGTLLVIDLEPSDIRPNQGLSGGVREDFECLADWPELSAKGAVRLAADYRIWLLVYPEDDRALAAAQAEPRARTVRVRFSNSPAAREARSMGLSGLPALLCAGGRHMGPFTLREDASHASYVTLASRTGDGLAPGFSASGAQPRRFSMMSRAGKDDWTERELTWVDDSRQAPQCFDLLTDEELLAHLAEAAPGFGATDAESPRGVERALERSRMLRQSSVFVFRAPTRSACPGRGVTSRTSPSGSSPNTAMRSVQFSQSRLRTVSVTGEPMVFPKRMPDVTRTVSRSMDCLPPRP